MLVHDHPHDHPLIHRQSRHHGIDVHCSAYHFPTCIYLQLVPPLIIEVGSVWTGENLEYGLIGEWVGGELAIWHNAAGYPIKVPAIQHRYKFHQSSLSHNVGKFVACCGVYCGESCWMEGETYVRGGWWLEGRCRAVGGVGRIAEP